MSVQAKSKTLRVQIDEELVRLKQSKTFNQKLKSLSRISTRRQLASLALDWFIIVGCFYTCMSASLGFKILALLAIASRQHALLTFVHEGAHYRIAQNRRLNDFIANYLAAYPLLFSADWYRKHHGAHHQYLNTPQDPDVSRRIGKKEWVFPQTRETFFSATFTRLLKGGQEWITLSLMIARLLPWKGWKSMASDLRKNPGVGICYFILFVGLIASGHALVILCAWFFSLLVIMPVFSHIRSVSEHWALPWEHELSDARNILANPIELFFIAPHGVNYHLVHHLFPSVPFYNLKELHCHLLEYEFYKKHAHTNTSYLISSHRSVLSDVLN